MQSGALLQRLSASFKPSAPRARCTFGRQSPLKQRPATLARASTARQETVESRVAASGDAGSQSASEPAAVSQSAEAKYDIVKQLRLQLGACNIPHPEKVSYGGEDAWFTSDVGGGALGVADGVGGWADSEVNPAEYAKTFMLVSKYYLEGKDVRMNEVNGSVQLVPTPGPLDTFDGDGERTPQGALDAGHVATRLPGSTTACIVRLNQDADTISAANLGDSGFVLIRNGFITFRSPVLQHFFDCPLQFGAVPEYTNASDYAEDADVFELAVQPGDLIIAASDGLWDNARDEEILGKLDSSEEDVNKVHFVIFEGSIDPRIAEAIATVARQNAENEEYESPYTVEALRQGIDLTFWDKLKKSSFSPRNGGFKLGKLQGGKIDDITVVIGRVAEEEVKVPRSVPQAEETGEADAAAENGSADSSSAAGRGEQS